MPAIGNEDWELDWDLEALEKAEQIKSDPKRMAQLESHLETKKSKLEDVEDFLFGGEPKDLSEEDSDETPKKGKKK